MRWTVLIPVKALPEAKTRLILDGSAARPGERATDLAHARLAEALRTDTIRAAGAAATTARIVLVVDEPVTPAPAGVEQFQQHAAGLNPALAEAAAHASRTWPDDGVAALLGDLPALRPDELTDALAQVGGARAGFVRDADGSGTTLLAVGPGLELTPRFGAGSAGRHAEIADELRAGPGLRRDVDTADDLRAALVLGVGPATSAAVNTPIAGAVIARSS